MSTTALATLQGQKQSTAFAQAFGAAPQESLSEGIGSGYGVVGYKGKVWDLRYRGQRYVFTRPDDGSPANHIDVIILRQAKVKSKSFYPKYDPNNSEGVRPICSSLDGIHPDPDVMTKQAEACAICPRNVWKTNEEGRKTRECTDYKRLAVLLLPSVTARMLGTQLLEPVFLRVPPASLGDLGQYGDNLNAQGFHYSAVVTRISFDVNQPHPKMVFQGLQALTDAEAPVVLPMREDINSLRITGEDRTSGIQGSASPQLVKPTPAETTVSTGLIAAPQGAPSVPNNVVQMTTAAPATPAPASTVQFNEPPGPQQQTMIVEDTDEALNARIKNILGG